MEKFKSSKMKICIIGTTIPPVMGGIEVHIWELSRQLARKGHNVSLIGYLKYKDKVFIKSEQKENVNIYRVNNNYLLGGYTTYIFNASQKVISLNKKFDFDIIHAHQSYPAGLIAKIVSAKIKIPYIVTSHGQEILILGKSLRFKPFLWWSLRGAKRVIGVSKELTEKSVECGAKKDAVITLANVVDTERFDTCVDSSKIRDRYNIAKEDTVILSLRRLEPKTGVQYLVEAARKVIAHFDKVCFLIVGDGYLKEKLIEKTVEYNIADHFIFTGSIDNEEIPSYISVSDFSVFPSLAEATSIACLEVMSCGKPVIASNVGGLPEIVSENVNGLIVDFGKQDSSYADYGLPQKVIDDLADAILLLCKNRDLRMKLGVNAREIVEKKYSWDGYIKKMEEIYKEAINEN